MAQDIRKMLKEERELPSEKLREGHLRRFEDKLEKNFPEEAKRSNSNRFFFLKIAAVLVVVLGVGALLYFGKNETPQPQIVEQQAQEEIKEVETEEAGYRLSDVSPEFRKIESFYLANLNVELAKLNINDENKALVDSFMAQLAELDREYNRLNLEIAQTGLSENSVEALIKNLQLRLELLKKLKTKIKELKEPKNEDYEDFQA